MECGDKMKNKEWKFDWLTFGFAFVTVLFIGLITLVELLIEESFFIGLLVLMLFIIPFLFVWRLT